MRRQLVLALVLVAACAVDALKFLVYNPMSGRSHVSFLGKKTADILVDAGHEVTMLVPLFDEKMAFTGSKKAKIIEVPQSPLAARVSARASERIRYIWQSSSFRESIEVFEEQRNAYVDQCNVTLRHPGLLKRLAAEHFDAAYGEFMDNCGFGIFEAIGIKRTAVVMSVGNLEFLFSYTGAPATTSYVPGFFGNAGDKMNFRQRLRNSLPLLIYKYIGPFFMPRDKMDDVIQTFNSSIPSVQDLLGHASLWFLNAEPLTDFPRPTVHKIIDVGGLSMSSGHKQLNQTWSSLLSLRKKNVLISFGSVAHSNLMPEAYKETIRNLARRMPSVTFIWKYEEPEDGVAAGVDNLVLVTWLPQNDMLHDGRLSLFVTHGGAGSTTESTSASVPMIVVPTKSGDQTRNAQIIARNGLGIIVQKERLGDGSSALFDAVQEVLGNPSYAAACRRVSLMLENRPFQPRDIFVRNMEFLARFGPLDMLDHHGRHQSFVEYYLLDVMAAVTMAFLTLLTVVFFALRRIFRSLISLIVVKKVKSE